MGKKKTGKIFRLWPRYFSFVRFLKALALNICVVTKQPDRLNHQKSKQMASHDSNASLLGPSALADFVNFVGDAIENLSASAKNCQVATNHPHL